MDGPPVPPKNKVISSTATRMNGTKQVDNANPLTRLKSVANVFLFENHMHTKYFIIWESIKGGGERESENESKAM